MAGTRGRNIDIAKYWKKIEGRGMPGERWQQQGSALPGVLLVILVLSLLGAGLLSLSLTERRGAANEAGITRATYLAEAGINLALARLRHNPAWREGVGETYLPSSGGRITGVSITAQTASYRLRSVGEIDGVRRAIEVDLARPFFTYALAGAGDLTIKKPLTVDGDIFATGSIYLQKDADGSVAAGEDLTIHNNTTVQGSVVTGRYLYNRGIIRGDATVGRTSDENGNDPNIYGTVRGRISKGLGFTFPAWPGDLTAPYTAGYPLAEGEYTLAEVQDIIDSALVANGDLKVLYCSGDLTITSGKHGKGRDSGNDTDFYTGRAIIAAAGDINLRRDIRAATASDALAFIAAGDIIMDGGVTVDAVLMSNGYFYKQGAPAVVNGNLIIGGMEEVEEEGGSNNSSSKGGGRGDIKGPLTISYREHLVQVLGPALVAMGWQVLSWRGASLY